MMTTAALHVDYLPELNLVFYSSRHKPLGFVHSRVNTTYATRGDNIEK